METMQLSINKIQLADEEDQKRIGEFVPAAPLEPGKCPTRYIYLPLKSEILKYAQLLKTSG